MAILLSSHIAIILGISILTGYNTSKTGKVNTLKTLDARHVLTPGYKWVSCIFWNKGWGIVE
jgi:hypothetical protein